jgi:hypothetical protein
VRRDRLRPAPQPIGPTPFPSRRPIPVALAASPSARARTRAGPRGTGSVSGVCDNSEAPNGRRPAMVEPSTVRHRPLQTIRSVRPPRRIRRAPAAKGPVGDETLGAPSSITRRSRHACSAFAAGPSPTQRGAIMHAGLIIRPVEELQDQAGLPGPSESPAREQPTPEWGPA